MTEKAYVIEWRAMAHEDLRKIVSYISTENPERALSFVQELRDKTKPLVDNPDLGKQGRPGLPNWLRELVVHRNYIIFYRVFADTRIVEILRVKHAAQQMP